MRFDLSLPQSILLKVGLQDPFSRMPALYSDSLGSYTILPETTDLKEGEFMYVGYSFQRTRQELYLLKL